MSVCLKSPVILNIDLTFLMPFHVLLYPVGHGQRFYLRFGPFVGWKLSVLTPAGLALCWKFLAVLILICAQFVAPGSDQMGM